MTDLSPNEKYRYYGSTVAAVTIGVASPPSRPDLPSPPRTERGQLASQIGPDQHAMDTSISSPSRLRILPTPIFQAFVVEPNLYHDERGFFQEIFSAFDLEKLGLDPQFARINSSFSERKGTLRGLHYQASPFAETKLVRCLSGSIWDCILDLRVDSPTFGSWHGQELSAENRLALYVPKGCAHGFLTLEEKTEVLYFSDEVHRPDKEAGVRWNDPRFGIEWPAAPTVLSQRDLALPDFV